MIGAPCACSVQANARVTRAVHPAPDGRLVMPVKMMDRPVAMSDTETVGGGNRIADESLGVANRCDEILAPGEASGDGRGQRASRAMGVAGGTARRRQGERAGTTHQIIDAV